MVVDCKWGTWSEGNCNATCGDAFRNIKRLVIQKAAYGGKNCTGISKKVEKCKLKPCPGKQF